MLLCQILLWRFLFWSFRRCFLFRLFPSFRDVDKIAVIRLLSWLRDMHFLPSKLFVPRLGCMISFIFTKCRILLSCFGRLCWFSSRFWFCLGSRCFWDWFWIRSWR